MANKLYNDFKIGDVVELHGWLSREDKTVGYDRRVTWVNDPIVRKEGEDYPVYYYVGWTVKKNGIVRNDYDYGSIFEDIGQKGIIVARLRRNGRANEDYALFSSIKRVEGRNPEKEWRKEFKWPDRKWENKQRKLLSQEAYEYKCPKCGKFLIEKNVYNPETKDQKPRPFTRVRECKCGFKDTKGFNKGKMVK